jgi:hypothetical protein
MTLLLLDQRGEKFPPEPAQEVTEPVANDPLALIGVIERAATNPAVDIEKMERLLAMQERIVARESEIAFNTAMSAAQAEMGRVSADAENPQTKSRYASYAQLDRALRPIYIKHGFSLSFGEADCPRAEYVRVTCDVAHSAGHRRVYHRDMPADGKGAKGGDVMTKTHAAGAAQSYGMRYLLKGIFNVAVGEDDRDGNEPDIRPTISESQVADFIGLLQEIKRTPAQYCGYAKLKRLEDMPAENYAEACRYVASLRRAAP